MKKFLVQIQDGPRTRWDVSDEILANHLQVLAQSVAKINSAGTIPAVTVILDETPENQSQPG